MERERESSHGNIALFPVMSTHHRKLKRTITSADMEKESSISIKTYQYDIYYKDEESMLLFFPFRNNATKLYLIEYNFSSLLYLHQPAHCRIKK